MFIDNDHQLKVRHRGFCGASDNWARLSSNMNTCGNGGHTFGGIGGTHRHGDWQVDYEAAPMTGYCRPSNRYGSDATKRHSNNYVYSSCGAPHKTINLDYVITKV